MATQASWGNPDTRPCFYKIIWPCVNVIKLRIPRAFKKHLPNEEADRATLRSGCGSWEVKLQCDEKGDLYLVEGWQEFIKHHSLADAEFLLFKYNGSMSFDVLIFDNTGCARTYDQPVEASPQESASHSTSSFPFFEHKIRKYNVGTKSTMLIPKAFSRKHLPSHSQITLRNSEGISWLVSITNTTDNRLCMTGGWKAFADANSVKKGDFCIFELVEKDVMQVHLFK